jgi:hypothetical protein
MKNKILYIFSFFLFFSFYSLSQEEFNVEGQILDQETKEPIPFAALQIKNKNLGIYASEDGEFTFRIKNSFLSDTLKISSIGYERKLIPLNSLDRSKFNVIYLKLNNEQLNEIQIVANKKKKRVRSKALIKEAIDRIPENYPTTPFKLTSYYRDYLKREGKYYNVNEAIVQTIDSGFNTTHYNNRFRLLDYNINKDFPTSLDIPDEYGSKLKKENLKKFMKHAKIPSQGGNELFILLAHDPLRNYKTNSFAFIYKFSRDFLKNHKFSKPVKVNQDEFPLYKIDFKSFKSLTEDQKVPNSIRINYNEPKNMNTEGVIIEGTIFINPLDYTIHKIEYQATLKSTLKKMYRLTLKYGYSPVDNLTMSLQYISFNNEFFAPDINKKNIFKVDSSTKTRAYILIKTTNPVDILSANNKSNYDISYENKKVEIRKIVSKDNEIRIYLKDPKKLNLDLSIVLKQIKDINNKVINQKEIVRYYQYRELFVKDFYTNEINFKNKCYMQNLPLRKNCISVSNDKRVYLTNSPLKNETMIKE